MDESRRSFASLYATNFFGVLNDNFLKTLASFAVVGWISDKNLQSVYMGATAAALVLPFVLLSPLADRLTVVFSKCVVVRLAKLAELPIVALAIAGFRYQSASLVIASVCIMGAQSALYSPSKYALVRDIGGVERISTGMGGMEGIAFLAMLLGTVAASWTFDETSSVVQWCALGGFAVVGFLLSLTIRAEEEPNRSIHSVNPIRYCVRACRSARRYPGLNAVIVTLSVFWFAAAMLQMGLLVYGQQVLGLDAKHTGMILALAAVGIVAGQVIAGFVDRRRFLLAANLQTGWIASAILFVLFFAKLSPVGFAVLVGILAFDIGFFKLPLDAEIQKTVKGPRLNAMLAYFNQVSFLFMMAASLVYMGFSWAFGPRAFLLVLAVVLFVTPLAFIFNCRRALVGIGHWVMSQRYEVRKTGFEVFDPQNVAYLVLPNHAAMVDPILLFAEFRDQPMSPLCDELYFANPISAAFLRTFDAVKVPDLRRRRRADDVKKVAGLQDVVLAALESGKNILFYPSGHIATEPREEIGTRQLAHNVCQRLPKGVRVVGVRTTGLWGSIWSREGRTKTPPFGPTLLKSFGLWLVCLVTRRRRPVGMTFEDLTERVRAWAVLPRMEFNRKLEEWYNA